MRVIEAAVNYFDNWEKARRAENLYDSDTLHGDPNYIRVRQELITGEKLFASVKVVGAVGLFSAAFQLKNPVVKAAMGMAGSWLSRQGLNHFETINRAQRDATVRLTDLFSVSSEMKSR